jgi:hypothetical protein
LAQQCKTPLHETFFSRRLIREYLDWSDWQIRAHITQLEALEYLHVRMGSQGKEYAYALNYLGQGAEKRRFYLNLTSVEEIEKRMQSDE